MTRIQHAFLWVFFVVLMSASAAMVCSADDLDLEAWNLPMPGFVDGEAEYFEIHNSNFRDVKLTSDMSVDAALSSIASLITIHAAERSDDAEVVFTLSGLQPDTQYYKYTDDLSVYAAIMSDQAGTVVFKQDLSIDRTIFIQTQKSTIFITESGGQCALIGAWNTDTKTCTLTHDVYDTIQISDDGITLDGDGFKMVVPDGKMGIYAFDLQKVAIKNMNITNAAVGISFNRMSFSMIENTIIHDDDGLSMGIKLFDSTHNTVLDNDVSGGAIGLYTKESGNTHFANNAFHDNAINLSFQDFELFTNVMDESNTIDGKKVYLLRDAHDRVFDATDEIGALYCFSCSNLTIEDQLISHNDYGINLVYSHDITIDRLNIKDAWVGVMLMGTSNVHLANSTISDSTYGVMTGVQAQNNAILNNTIIDIADIAVSIYEGNQNTIAYNRIDSHAVAFEMYDAPENQIYNNAITAGTVSEDSNSVNYYSKELPIGGNYWHFYDEVSEGCNDADGYCDDPVIIGSSSDDHPWVAPHDDWGAQMNTQEENLMSFVNEEGYGQDSGDKGVEPNKGVADKTKMQFKIIVQDDDAPGMYSVQIAPVNLQSRKLFPITLARDAAAPEHLRDNDLSNGEQFIGEGLFPKGQYEYFYAYQNGDSTKRFPEVEALHFQTGHSSVVFLPGHQASRLYKDGVAHEDRLWEPNIALQLDELMMEDGQSARDDIYTRDIIDEAYTELQGGNVYKKFELFMNDQVENGTLEEWKALAYDWRIDLKDLVVRGSIEGENGGKENISYEQKTLKPYLLDQMQQIANRSPSDQITIVTHSNGGLLAKYLLAVIQDPEHPLHNDMSIVPYHGLADRIDKVILVAVPQLGTPKGLEALMHGDESEMPREFGLFVDEKQLRRMSEEMTSAYNLMPSKHYFDVVEDPVIEFSDDVIDIYDFRGFYDDKIDNYRDFTSFLLGDDGIRDEPDNGDVDSPNVLDEDLLDDSEETHDILHNWTMPEQTEIIQIAGWGLKTIRGIKYDDCDIIGCPDKLSNLDRQIKMTHVGDGTVVLPSAISMGNQEDVETYYVDVREHNYLLRRNRSHANILEIDSLEDFIIGINTNNFTLTDDIYSDQPELHKEDVDLSFRLHSPVEIHLYDEYQSHTGLWKEEDNSGRFYEATIPNSYYKEYGETKYAGGTDVRTIKLVGEDLGTFTLEIDKLHGDDIIESGSFIDIPVTASTIAKIQISEDNVVGEMTIDVDGDGKNDATITSGDSVDTAVQLQLLRSVVSTMDLHRGVERYIVRHILLSERFYQYRKMRHAKHFLSRIEHIIDVMSRDRIPEKYRIDKNDAKKLIEVIIKIKNEI